MPVATDEAEAAEVFNPLFGVKNAAIMTEAIYSANFRTQRGTGITVRGNTTEDWVYALLDVNKPVDTPEGPLSALDAISSIDAALGGGVAPAQDAASQQQQSLTPACESCGGATLYKEGENARGKWKGYFCQVSKDHKPKFIR